MPHRHPLLHMILALAIVTFGGALAVGFAVYPQAVVWEELQPAAPFDGSGDADQGDRVVAYLEREVSCPGPLRSSSEVLPMFAERRQMVWPPSAPYPCRYQREERQAGVWLALSLSLLAGVTALALLRRDGPTPDLDPPQPDPVTREVPDL